MGIICIARICKIDFIKSGVISCTWLAFSENRYLLFLTENYAALDILKHYLSGVDSSHTLKTTDVMQETMEPFVLFGSSFPKDKEYTQVRSII